MSASSGRSPWYRVQSAGARPSFSFRSPPARTHRGGAGKLDGRDALQDPVTTVGIMRKHGRGASARRKTLAPPRQPQLD